MIGPLDATPCSLLPCPFCGSSPHLYEVVDMMSCGWVVRCLNPECPIRPHTVEGASRDVSVGWWNCRANNKPHPLMNCPKCGELRGHGHICEPNVSDQATASK